MGEERFEKLYPIEGTFQWVALDKENKNLCLRKELKTYDISVYRYLAEHRNPHVADVIEYFKEGEMLIVYEEYVQARTLEEVIEQETLSFKEAKRIFLEICDGVSFFHKADVPIVHRDLKLTNILLTNDRVVKIVDYDASKVINRYETKDTILLGTEGYAAPEQYGFGSSDERTDIYALGIIGKKLFPPKKYNHLFKKATQIDPNNRYQSVDELKNIIDRTMKATKSLYPPPGFRTGNIKHMIIAILCHAMWFGYFMQDIPVDVEYLHFIPSHFIIYIWAYLAVVDVCTDWTGLFEGLPGIKSESKGIRFFSKTVFSFLAICVCSLIVRFFDALIWEIIKLIKTT